MAEQNKALTERLTQLWNSGDVGLVDEIYTPGFVNHDPSRQDVIDLDSFKRWIAELFASMPDFQLAIEDVIAADDRMATRWVSSGTHQGAYAGIPPTGKQATWVGMNFYRLAGGRIAEAWRVYDSLGAMQQLGIIPAPQAA